MLFHKPCYFQESLYALNKDLYRHASTPDSVEDMFLATVPQMSRGTLLNMMDSCYPWRVGSI